MFLCRFAAEGMTLGKDEKRVKQVLTIPIDDNGEEDLYSHLSDLICFIGKKIPNRFSFEQLIILAFFAPSLMTFTKLFPNYHLGSIPAPVAWVVRCLHFCNV